MARCPQAKPGGPGPVSLDRPTGFHRVCRRHAPTPQRFGPCIQRPNALLVTRAVFRHALALPTDPRIQGRQALPRCLDRLGGVVNSEPFWERPAGTQTHSRRTGRKLGQVRYARQGLVRVPESNTKYGGQRGITGGDAAPVIEPSISESSGIPKRKKFSLLVSTGLAPQFTGHVFFATGGLRFKDSRYARRFSDLPCPGHPWWRRKRGA